MVGGTAMEDMAGVVIHESNQISCSMTVIAIIDFETAVTPWQIRHVAGNRLQTRTFVETKQIGIPSVVH